MSATVQYRTAVQHRNLDELTTVRHPSLEQAEEWLAQDLADYGAKLVVAEVQRRTVSEWETVDSNHERAARHLDANEHRIIIAALETYQSIWAAAVSEARKDGEPTDERLAQGRYDEAGELLAKFKRDPEGGSAADAIGWMDADIAAEQARDRERATR